ncbi:hypothetical protein [Streptomyces sp. ST2-7A]|uniref:hypothetical protein n=1 Tax=Streptomyces sp. ST2-7A TaxID=2907214 RepID=UPI001F47E9FA|nr:hypothetical protein [Streptomyces sp. ST2-7A]MCE7081131.1 hypothetical protein [Streptomyces sp. ST2-7A]
MSATGKPRKPIHPDTPTTRAWQTGRRIYVRAGYHSQLNRQLVELGTHWDPNHRARWIGTTKREAVTALVLAAETRIREIEAVKQAGRWIVLPYGAAHIHRRLRETNAIFCKHTKAWAVRTDTAYAEIAAMVEAWNIDLELERVARQETRRLYYEEQRLERRRAEAVHSARLREKAIVDSGRTLLGGDILHLTEVTRRFHTKATALATARDVGEVMRLDDGCRALVVGSEVHFTNEIDAYDCRHPDMPVDAHWHFSYDLLLIEPTEEELAEETGRAMAGIDADELHALMTAAARLTAATAEDRWTPTPEDTLTGEIVAGTGFRGMVPAGRLMLTRDGRVIWQHPGFHPEYIRSEGLTADPTLVQRLRDALAPGARTRVVPGTVPVQYTVRTHDHPPAPAPDPQ